MALNNTEDVWNSYKELKGVIWKYLNRSEGDLPPADLENVLRKHKQSFFALLQNPPKNAKNRDELKKGMVEGINVKGIGHQILSKELYQETIILSDLFDLNEFVALDLLCTAQIQMPYYPGLPRGLVAVLLYYDGRKALVTSLLYLVQARSGIQWSVNIKPELARFVMAYTDQLLEGGLFNRIFELLRSLDLTKEVEKLQQNLAIGGPKHRRQVTDLFNDIRNVLADIVFSWASQRGLPKEPTLGLISYLREVKIDTEATGAIDDVNLYLQMALLSALDLSVLHTREDGEEVVQMLPILSDPSYIGAVINEFLPGKPNWVSEGLQALSVFGLAVCTASLRVVPENYQYQVAINKEESLADTAIELNVFTFIHNVLLENQTIFKEQFLCKRLHNLITDFLVYMYPKVKDLRMKANEIARTIQVYVREGLEAPTSLPHYFEYLLLTMAKFYSNKAVDPEYAASYWSPVEVNPSSASTSYRVPSRSVSLFKFIRLAGDMLPSSLFVPFIKMLSGLSSTPQTARHCFNFLKQAQMSNTITWDHFFLSFAQYYNNLRHETPPQADTIYRNRPGYHRGVSPQELEGLHAVLLLIRTVAENDEFSRLALCEHPGWSPLTILLGLVSCSVPIPLKADLLLTLAALSKSTENATQMWENLEASQILVTIPTTSSYAPRGIQTELEEIESRVEEYPLTRALLVLLDTLTNFGIPRTLGAGPRKPGFDPYLLFIINSVFLKYNSRSYRNPAEKWDIARLCLKLFEKFLNQYDPRVEDFPTNNHTEYNTPPGYHLMIQLNNKSETLTLILDIIDEGNKFFDSYVSFQGQEKVKDCSLICLSIVQRALVLQPRMLSVLAMSQASLILTSINKLLLTINRKSGKPDHCINIAKYVTYQMYLPQHSLTAVKILCHITNSPVGHNQFVNVLLSMDEAHRVIKSGFFECLDATGDDMEVLLNTKKEILRLLKQCLPYNSPNLTHLLLGFDLKKDISKTEFQYPGVLNFPRTCLHSLLTLLESSILKYVEEPTPDILENAYQLLYLLASNVKTSSPVLRFVRLNKSFYKDHLTESRKKVGKSPQETNQLSWLLKTLAIELKVVAQSKQISYLKSLTGFLTNVPSDTEDPNDMFSLVQKSLLENKIITPDDIKLDNFMTSLIQHFEFKTPSLDTPTWEFFDNNALNQILQSCQKKISPKLIDLKKLHQILCDELKNLLGTVAIGQMQAINQEIPKVLKHALTLNKQAEYCSSTIDLVDAWRQVAEVLVTFMPLDILNTTEQQVISLSLLLSLLKNVTKLPLLPEVSRYLSGATLLMIDNMRRCYFREFKFRKITPQVDSALNIMTYYFNALKDIMEGLVQWIMISDVVDGELRINLYAALTTLLQITNIETPHSEIAADSSLYVSRLDSSSYSIEGKEKQLSVPSDLVSTFGEKLVEVLCHDCIGGQEICNILAMSSFSHLMSLSGNINWIIYISGRGYLKHMIQSIMDSDKDLRIMLEPNADTIKPLYVYLAKMLLLARLAGLKMGAEYLLEQKLLGVFSNMSVFSYHPEISKIWQGEEVLEDFLPTIEQQYLQIWMPTLHICNAILTTLGTENQSAVAQIMYFLLSHLDVVELILRSGHVELSPASLKELALLTSIIARTASNDLINILENPNLVDSNRGQLHRIQKLMFSLMPKFILSEDSVKKLLSYSNNEKNQFQTSDRLLYAMQVASNLLCYARNIVANHDIQHGGVGVIFYPSLNDPLLTSHQNKSIISTNEQEPSLGVVIQQLISTVNYQHQEKGTHDLLQRKINEIPEMNSAELKSFIDDSFEMCDIAIKREKAYEIVSDRLEKKRKEMRYCAFIIENALYLIWAHLDYYMLRAIPKPRAYIHSNRSMSTNNNSSLATSLETTWKVSTEVISHLKQGLVSLFNDSFSKQLLETAQERSESDRGFIYALLRKVKRLVQFVPVK